MYVSRQASVAQSKHNVFPVPVGDSRMPFLPCNKLYGELSWLQRYMILL